MPLPQPLANFPRLLFVLLARRKCSMCGSLQNICLLMVWFSFAFDFNAYRTLRVENYENNNQHRTKCMLLSPDSWTMYFTFGAHEYISETIFCCFKIWYDLWIVDLCCRFSSSLQHKKCKKNRKLYIFTKVSLKFAQIIITQLNQLILSFMKLRIAHFYYKKFESKIFQCKRYETCGIACWSHTHTIWLK